MNGGSWKSHVYRDQQLWFRSCTSTTPGVQAHALFYAHTIGIPHHAQAHHPLGISLQGIVWNCVCFIADVSIMFSWWTIAGCRFYFHHGLGLFNHMWYLSIIIGQWRILIQHNIVMNRRFLVIHSGFWLCNVMCTHEVGLVRHLGMVCRRSGFSIVWRFPFTFTWVPDVRLAVQFTLVTSQVGLEGEWCLTYTAHIPTLVKSGWEWLTVTVCAAIWTLTGWRTCCRVVAGHVWPLAPSASSSTCLVCWVGCS